MARRTRLARGSPMALGSTPRCGYRKQVDGAREQDELYQQPRQEQRAYGLAPAPLVVPRRREPPPAGIAADGLEHTWRAEGVRERRREGRRRDAELTERHVQVGHHDRVLRGAHVCELSTRCSHMCSRHVRDEPGHAPSPASSS